MLGKEPSDRFAFTHFDYQAVTGTTLGSSANDRDGGTQHGSQ